MTTGEVTIQVKYDPKGLCIACSEAPPGVSAQAWHDYLADQVPTHPLSGGRAAFYLTHEELARFKLMEGSKEWTA
jgi:hypothetical protein